MRRASRSITLVLVSSSLILYGCGGGVEYTAVPSGPPAGDSAATLPGNPTTYKYVAPYYYPANAVTMVRRPSSSWGSSWGSSGHSSSWGSSSGGWGSSSSSGSSNSSHSSSVSRGGFGGSAHSFSGGGHSSGS